jgi:hypothetical protein
MVAVLLFTLRDPEFWRRAERDEIKLRMMSIAALAIRELYLMSGSIPATHDQLVKAAQASRAESWYSEKAPFNGWFLDTFASRDFGYPDVTYELVSSHGFKLCTTFEAPRLGHIETPWGCPQPIPPPLNRPVLSGRQCFNFDTRKLAQFDPSFCVY